MVVAVREHLQRSGVGRVRADSCNTSQANTSVRAGLRSGLHYAQDLEAV